MTSCSNCCGLGYIEAAIITVLSCLIRTWINEHAKFWVLLQSNILTSNSTVSLLCCGGRGGGVGGGGF